MVYHISGANYLNFRHFTIRHILLASQDAIKVMFVTEQTFADLTDVSLVSEDIYGDEYEGDEDEDEVEV